jgi:hypothetical protein
MCTGRPNRVQRTCRPATFLFGRKRTKLRRISHQQANRARVQRVNGTEAAEFRAMELSVERPGNSLNEGIAGPHGRFDRTNYVI